MTELETVKNENLPIELGVADSVIAELGARLNGITADTPTRYQMVKAGIQETRHLRTGVDRSRKELKRDPTEFCRKVDAEARRLTHLLLEIENPLKDEKDRVDDEKELIKKEKAEKLGINIISESDFNEMIEL